MKPRYEALIIIAILSVSVCFSYFFLKPDYYPIIEWDPHYYIMGKIEFRCWNRTDGRLFLGNLSVELFLTEDGGLMEIVNITKGRGRTYANYCLGEGLSPILRPPGAVDTILPYEFVLRYLNRTVRESPRIFPVEKGWGIGDIWLGI